MLTAIDLNNETLLEADKIKNIALEWDLSAKLEVSELPMTQQPPHRGFRVSRFLSH